MFKWKKSSAAEVVDLAAFAQRLLHYRKLRGEFFDGEAIASGGWDVLLLLYSESAGAEPVTIGSAARALGVASGEAIGAANRLCHYRLAEQGDSTGRWESIPLALTAEGRTAMDGYLGKFAAFGQTGTDAEAAH